MSQSGVGEGERERGRDKDREKRGISAHGSARPGPSVDLS
jgi:hypothetical protein